MEKLTQKWAIISLLEEVPDGTEFYYTGFPPHVTMAGIFGIDKPGAWLTAELAELANYHQSYDVKADTIAMFGPNQDVAVMQIQQTHELMSLYQQLHDWLLASGAKFIEPHYEGSGYIPHVTIQKAGTIRAGEVKRINSISLVDLFPNGDGYQRRVTKTITLSK